MTERRDDDVHHGTVDATSLYKYIDAQTFRGVHVFGYPFEAQVEETSPDGTKVRAQALTPVPTLYIDHAGNHMEATSACQKFIGLLRSLIGQFKSLAGTATTV